MKFTTTIDPADLLEKALFVLQDGICIVEKNTTIVYINCFAQDMLEKNSGRRPFAGDNLLDFIVTERVDANAAFIAQAFNNQTSSCIADYSGGKEWYEIDYYPMTDESGSVNHVCVKARDITQRIFLEKKLQEERKAGKNKLVKATIKAQERERSLIGRELHDNVNQVLTTVKLYTEICYYDEVPNKELLKRSVQQVNYCIEEIRSLSKRLAVPRQGEFSLEELIRDLVDTINSTKKTSIELITYGIKNKEYNQDLQTSIYRIIQEQLTNIIKYAHASSVKVILAATPADIAVEVQDNGIGFNFQEKKKGNGILNMMTRAEIIGGSIKFETSPGHGCSMIAEFPLS